MNDKLYQSKRPGTLGALMDLYEQEALLLLDTINNKLPAEDWTIIKDAETKDEDCRSYQTICQHVIVAAKYYIELLKKGENLQYEIATIEERQKQAKLTTKSDFELALKAILTEQESCLEKKWDMDWKELSKIKIKTGWGNILDPDGLMEHAVMHLMRHHRQILKFLQ